MKIKKKEMRDEDATPGMWLMLDFYAKMILGDRHELQRSPTMEKKNIKKAGARTPAHQ